MRILDRYVARTFLGTLGLVLLFVLGMIGLFGVLSVLESAGEAEAALERVGLTVSGAVLRYFATTIPFLFLRIAPFVNLIAAAIAIMRLLRNNEITPMMVAGRSPTRILAPIFGLSLVLVVAMLAVQQWVVPRLAETRENLSAILKGDERGDEVGSVTDDAGNTWSIDHYDSFRDTIIGVKVIRFRDPLSGEILGSIRADRARYLPDGPGGPGWYPRGAILRPLDFRSPRELSPDDPLPTTFEPIEIELRMARDAGSWLSLTSAARLADAYPEEPRFRFAFHTLLTWPLSAPLLLLLGLPLLLRFRETNLFVGLGIALLFSALYFSVETVASDLGTRSVLPPEVAAWLPVVLFASLSLALLDNLRG